MSEILIPCKVHGFLTTDKFYKTNNRYRCKECHRLQFLRTQSRSKLNPKTIEEYILKTCKKHGDLKKEQVYVDTNFNTFKCKMCVIENTKKNHTEKREEKNRRQREYRAKNIEKYRKKSREAQAKRRKDNPEYVKKMNTIFYKRNPEKQRLYRILTRYGLTSKQYMEMYDNQKGLCAICGNKNYDAKSAWLVVDHDHISGNLRALLCNKCNKGLGHFNDSIDLFYYAIAYLKRFTPEA